MTSPTPSAERAAPPSGPLRVLIPALLVISFVLGSASVHRPQDELFPFSSWNLFSFVPQDVTRFEARVLALPSGALSSPADPARHPATRPRYRVRHVTILQRLGDALARGDDEQIALERGLLEARLFPEGTRYQVVEVIFDPVERFRSGVSQEVRPVATFLAGGGER